MRAKHFFYRTERLLFCSTFKGGNCVGNNHGVTVSEKLMKLMEKSPILNQLRIDIK